MQTCRWSWLGLVTVVALGAPTRPATACSGDACGVGYFVPAEGATAPANLPAVVWQPLPAEPAPAPGAVALTGAAGTIPLASDGGGGGVLELRLGAPLAPGAAYALTDATVVGDACHAPGATFTATAAAPLPTRLGATVVAQVTLGDVTQPTTAGSCFVTAPAVRAEVQIALAPEAEPWRDVLLFATLVDGGPWAPRASLRSSYPPGASWQGRGVDRVFHACANDVGVTGVGATGPHTIEIVARVPGTATVLRSDPVEVELRCPAAVDAGASSGADPGGCAAAGGDGAGAIVVAALAMLRRRRRRAGYEDISSAASTQIATISAATST